MIYRALLLKAALAGASEPSYPLAGDVWAAASHPALTHGLYASAYDATMDVFVIGGNDNQLFYSSSGKGFTAISSTFPSSAYVANAFSADGTIWISGSGGALAKSTDGANFFSVASGTSAALNAGDYNPATGRIITGDGSGSIRTSDNNGGGWTLRSSGFGSNTIQDVHNAASSNTWVAVGAGGRISSSSDDGTTWTLRSTPTSVLLYKAAYGNGVFVAVGDSGTVLTSSDGVTWTARSIGTADLLTSVAFGNGRFVIMGWGGAWFSEDGVSWTRATTEAWGTSDMNTVCYGKGMYVAGAQSAGGIIAYSEG